MTSHALGEDASREDTILISLVGEMQSVLAALEHQARRLGALPALPYLGLARWELAEGLASPAPPQAPPLTSLHDAVGELHRLVALARRTSGLERSLRLSRAATLIREASSAC